MEREVKRNQDFKQTMLHTEQWCQTYSYKQPCVP